MIRAAHGIGAAGSLPAIEGPRPIDAPRSGSDFASALGNAISSASSAERSANEASARFAAGDPQVGIHEVVIASEKANISVRYAVTLKNRAIEAYRELLNTPV